MNSYLLTLMIFTASCFDVVAETVPEPPATVPIALYVGTEGDDRWTGLLASPNSNRTDGPLATPQGARDAIRQIRSQPGTVATPVTVYVDEGTYFLAEPLIIEPQDSGTAQAPVVFTAKSGTRPLLSGGRVIRHWKAIPEGTWSVQIPEVVSGEWYFQQLFINGQRRSCAKSPNIGYFRMLRNDSARQGEQFFRFSPDDIQTLPSAADARAVVFHSWETSRHRVASLDEAQQRITLIGSPAWKFGFWEPEQRYWIENLHEALDAPGEWYLDRNSGTLFYYPMPGEDIHTIEAVAPRLTQLVELRGKPETQQFVEYVTFSGIAFSHEDWTLEPRGHSDYQACITSPAAIMADGAQHCAIENCELSHLGDYAIWFRRGCQHCRIVGNRIHDVGVGGIRIGEVKAAADDVTESSHNLIDNNHLDDGGHVYAGGVGIWIAQSSHNTVSHNEIHDFFYSGMSIGWNWDDAPNRTHHNILEHNHVHHVLKGMLSDGGAIYTLGTSPGSIIRNNVLHDVWAYETPRVGWGIYLDGTTNGYLVENNLVYNTSSGGIMFRNGAHGLTIRNNIFAHSKYEALWPYWGKQPSSFRQNIIYLTQGTLMPADTQALIKHRLATKEPLSDWDGNLYWHQEGREQISFAGESFLSWQAIGLDPKSQIADPEFVDATNYNFQLKSTSPALKLGFQPIDAARAGLDRARSD